MPLPKGSPRHHAIGVEPFLLEWQQLFGGTELGIGLVDEVEQVLVWRHELGLTMWHIHKRY